MSESLLSRWLWEVSVEKTGCNPQNPRLWNGSWMLRGHVGGVEKVEEEGVWLPAEVCLHEGGVVVTFAKKDKGPSRTECDAYFLSSSFMLIPWTAFAEAWKWSAMCLLFMRTIAVLDLIRTASGKCSDVLRQRAHSRIRSDDRNLQSLGSVFLH